MATRKIKPRTPDPKRGQSSEEYWREREARQRAENIRNEAKTAEKINRIFATVQDDIQQEIDSFYHRYAKDEGIDLIEARRRVSQLDIKKYERLAQQYVKAAHEGAADAAFSEEANEQMRLYNTTMRINRLEMLKARCGIRAMNGYSEAEKLINDELEERAYSEYERLSGILGNTVQFNENLVRSIVNTSYQNATWSDRLWNNQSLLSEQIGAQLAQGILTGKGSRVLAANIQKLTGQSAYNCLRLMRTELRRVQTAAAEQSMRDNGVRQYKFMVENAINPCDECLNLDGHVYDLDELAPGKTAPPIHPNCHCATAPYVDEEKWQRWLDGPAQEGVPWADFENGNAPEESAGSGQESADTSGIEYDPRVSDEQKNILRSLVDEYRTRLQNVTIGAQKAAGDVDVSGARMRLSDKHAGTAFHEFAHTLANTNADKFGLTHDQAFWKEIKKIRREYMKDVENDPSRWISSYEHSGRSLDEFMCEAFAHAKMRERGIQPHKSYGSDYTYSQRVLDTVDKYFRRSKKK